VLKYAHGGIAMNTSNITNYKPKDFAELLGVSVKTLQRWDREGTLKANRTPTDRRYYTYNQYLQFKGINTENDTRQIVIYARVSTRDQKDDLQDIVSILHVFSCRLYGLRKYKKQIERDEEIAKELQDGNQPN
jgi:predicted site-specific integrase-resolvase